MSRVPTAPPFRTGRDAVGQIDAVAVIGIAEGDIVDARRRLSCLAPFISSTKAPYSPMTWPLAPSTNSAVFSSMPKPRRTPCGRHGHDQPPEAAALDEMLVDHAPGKKPSPAHQEAGLVGSRTTPKWSPIQAKSRAGSSPRT